MTRWYIAAAAVLALVACGQPAETKEEAPPAPQSMLDEVNAMAADQQPIFAYQQLVAYQQTHTDVTPPCTAVRGVERINVPENVAPDSIYAPHVGAAVFTVQCGALISATRMDPAEKWLVVFAPGAASAAVEHCLGERNADRCPRQPPTAAAPATTTP